MDDKNIHFVIMRIRVYKCEFSVYTVRIFMKCWHVCEVQKANKLLIKPDFPSITDGIAQPRQDMNIKVAAFTESKNSSYTFRKCLCVDVFCVLHSSVLNVKYA